MAKTTTRSTAAERRDEVLDAAMIEFADHGFDGASTENIARRAGISQPYLFRLFGTKKELFKATVSRCFRETLEMFQRAAEGKRGEEALQAIGTAYLAQLESDRTWLRGQMQSYAASADPEIRLAGGLGLLRDRHALQRPRLDARRRQARPVDDRAPVRVRQGALTLFFSTWRK
jgi:AcrR family transcriptional regulator